MADRKKKKRAKSRKKQKSAKKILVPEISGIVLLFIGVLFLVSLVSYNSMDPSWANTAVQGQKTHNIAGRVGAYLSEGLLQAFGLISFVLVLGLFYLGIGLIRQKEELRVGQKLTGSLVLLFLLCTLFSTLFDKVAWKGTEFSSGGLIGHLLSSLFIRYLNHLGTVLILTVLLLLFILFTTHLSIVKITQGISRMFHFSFQKVRIRITHYQKLKTKEKMRQKVMEKHLGPKTESKKTKKKKKGEKEPEKPKPAKAAKPAVPVAPKKPAAQEKLPFPDPIKRNGYILPSIKLLDKGKPVDKIDKNELLEKKELIEEKLAQFGVTGEVRQYHPGPVITTYEFFPDAGIKVSKVANLSEEVSMALAAISVRIQRIPGRSSLGIEVPNNRKETIRIRDVIESQEFLEAKSKLTYALGKTVHDEIYITDLTKMPHLLIAGATGTGKSVALNSLIASILYKATPEEVKFILIDPKRIELSNYEGIPHLFCPIIKNPRKAEAVLLDAIKKMEERYRQLGLFSVRNIEQYNRMVTKILEDRRKKLTEEELEQLKPMPYIVIIIDELAELMMVGAKEIQYCISRLAQLARAVGIHLVMATQRPSTDIITGTIKNNFSSRISFRVPTKIDSRVILDQMGAEKLLGDGDMLFIPPKNPRLTRLHGSFMTLSEVNRLIKFVKEQGIPEYDEQLVEVIKKPLVSVEEEEEEGQKDPLFDDAVRIILTTGQASASYLQRRLKLGYARAARIIDQMEQEGIVGPTMGSKPREILVDRESYVSRIDDEYIDEE